MGLILLAVGQQPPLSRPETVGGLLAAGLTAPHALGPVVARRLDRGGDSRRYLAAAFSLYGVALAAATMSLSRSAVAPALAATLVAGVCGPLLTGGLSSRVAELWGPEERSRRRGEAWDSLTYGLAATAGPAGVALLASTIGAPIALYCLCAAAGVAAVITLTLPPDASPGRAADGAPGIRAVLVLLVRHGPLRRVNLATMLTAFSGGGMTIIAVLLGTELTGHAAAGATLVAAYGLGSLGGSLLLTAWPLRGEPERLTTRHVALVGVAIALCALAPTYVVALVLFALAGVANAPFVTATFAARSQYAPPQSRAQVFVSMASLKIAAAAAGSAVAGIATVLGPRGLPAAGAAVVLLGSAITIADRRLTTDRADD